MPGKRLSQIPRPPTSNFTKHFEPLYRTVEDQRNTIEILKQQIAELQQQAEVGPKSPLEEEPGGGGGDPGIAEG